MGFQFIQNMYGMQGSESYANRYVVCEFVMQTRQIIYCDSKIIVCEQLQIKILQCQLL
jgi:lipopolysaccharide biosynthesis glycosyltransferase